MSIERGDGGGAYIRIEDVETTKSWVATTTPIPQTPEWMGPHRTVPSNPHIPKALTILVNKAKMDRLNDFQRTYTLTHEMGHTLGLGHPDELCGSSDTSIMEEGDNNTFKRNFNTPTYFDKMELKQLYGQ